MKNSITIVCTAKMGYGTFEAKFCPLVKLEAIKQIIVVRKEAGPEIPKLKYVLLPKLCQYGLMNMIIAPVVVSWVAHKSKADLILAYHYIPHFFFAYFASCVTGKPYILGQTGSDDQILAKKPVKGWLLRHIIRRAIQLNVPGQSSYMFWKSIGSPNVRILHSTIDTDYFIPSNTAKVFDFIYVGRLEDYKGVDLLLKAVRDVQKSFPRITIAIVGYGTSEGKYKAMVKDWGIADNVQFFGLQRDVRAWLHKSRIFVMASDGEGLPCALMEAMSCGMVCISSIVGNVGDLVIEGETGFGLAPRDQNRLVELMIYTYENEHVMNTLKINARQLIVNEHSYLGAIRAWREVLE